MRDNRIFLHAVDNKGEHFPQGVIVGNMVIVTVASFASALGCCQLSRVSVTCRIDYDQVNGFCRNCLRGIIRGIAHSRAFAEDCVCGH